MLKVFIQNLSPFYTIKSRSYSFFFITWSIYIRFSSPIQRQLRAFILHVFTRLTLFARNHAFAFVSLGLQGLIKSLIRKSCTYSKQFKSEIRSFWSFCILYRNSFLQNVLLISSR